LREVYDDARESMLDIGEQSLYTKVEAGDIAALIFFLKTQGKNRGYTERQETTGPNGGPVEVKSSGDRSPADDARFIAAVLAEVEQIGARASHPTDADEDSA